MCLSLAKSFFPSKVKPGKVFVPSKPFKVLSYESKLPKALPCKY
jgi:hypothetical protein